MRTILRFLEKQSANPNIPRYIPNEERLRSRSILVSHSYITNLLLSLNASTSTRTDLLTPSHMILYNRSNTNPNYLLVSHRESSNPRHLKIELCLHQLTKETLHPIEDVSSCSRCSLFEVVALRKLLQQPFFISIDPRRNRNVNHNQQISSTITVYIRHTLTTQP